jgi:putative transcriptional regulator
MATTRKTLADLKANPLKLTDEQEAALTALSDDDINRAAESDPDNPPMTDDELARAQAARLVKKARARVGGSQAEFAKRFNINLARLKDWERGRFQPDSVALSYLRVIEMEPKAVDRALKRKNVA